MIFEDNQTSKLNKVLNSNTNTNTNSNSNINPLEDGSLNVYQAFTPRSLVKIFWRN